MAEVLESYSFSGIHGNAKYPWSAWTNGETWRIVQGEDFDVEPRVMQGQIKVRGGKESKKTATRVESNAVIFTFQRSDESDGDFYERVRPAAPTA